MSVTIYNSITRQKEQFVPIEAGKVRMYVCGPTVYDYIHIGNARPAIFFDVVRRYLEHTGLEVNYISNFTDVDDKLIRKANELGTTVNEVADKFIAAFHEDTSAIGIRPANLNPRVMDHIDEVVEFIAGLVDKGHAYESAGDVYFSTSTFPDYGKLSHQNLDELQHGIRVELDERKDSEQDFVLWKSAKPGEISWESPWGKGRPGWHIECSAMARKYLGDTLDIHGGGLDLQFPHHECEVAQSECLTGESLAHYWMHNGYIHINNEKMSKSLGNGITVREIVKNVKPQAIRYFMLAAHYRSPLNFSDDTVAQALNSVDRITNSYNNVLHRLELVKDQEQGSLDAQIHAELLRIELNFNSKMNDDFNTPDAITALFELVALANTKLQDTNLSYASIEAIEKLFLTFDNVLGLLPEKAEVDNLEEQVEQLIVERTEARATKNWARADEIRDLLNEMNIVLEDTPQGIRWRRK
ncbi:MAG: cysteine--tRNA ligase [Candidatus Pristimantibacillus lignocellulolyticus]|uniref:Cysteine--tRNA ligase n=1 Tax=Candidatus Pristimantibacillus lignocellulolyticus TaxID=2994561 RepID=A0A9J6ZIZ3_9BACL|nr:MAG: cysteine--tRNA ligase [Candidatus Pristimantibacillus lignocellulolyticus]